MEYRNIEPQAIYIDTLTAECGLFTSKTDLNNGYGCRSKSKDKEHPGCCYTFDCPLGYEMVDEDPLWEASYSPGYWVMQVRELAKPNAGGNATFATLSRVTASVGQLDGDK